MGITELRVYTIYYKYNISGHDINIITCLTMISHKSGSAITAIASGKIFAFSSVYAWLSLAFVDVYKKTDKKH